MMSALYMRECGMMMRPPVDFSSIDFGLMATTLPVRIPRGVEMEM